MFLRLRVSVLVWQIITIVYWFPTSLHVPYLWTCGRLRLIITTSFIMLLITFFFLNALYVHALMTLHIFFLYYLYYSMISSSRHAATHGWDPWSTMLFITVLDGKRLESCFSKWYCLIVNARNWAIFRTRPSHSTIFNG